MKTPRAPFVLTLSAAALAPVACASTQQPATNPPMPDPALVSTNPPAPQPEPVPAPVMPTANPPAIVCPPTEQLREGDACPLPDMRCQVPSNCAHIEYVCTNGRWHRIESTCNPPPPPPPAGR